MSSLLNNELTLCALPTDIIRRIIPVDQILENMESMRLVSYSLHFSCLFIYKNLIQISPRWNQLVREYLDTHLSKLTRAVLDHFHWTVSNDRKSTLSMTVPEELQEYFGVGKWPKVRADFLSDKVRQIRVKKYSEKTQAKKLQYYFRIQQRKVVGPIHVSIKDNSNITFTDYLKSAPELRNSNWHARFLY